MTALGLIHTLSAVSALLLGPNVFFRRKGTRLHKKLGYSYVISMLMLNLTAFMIYRLFGGWGPFHWLAVVSLATMLAGFIPAFLKRPKNWIDWHYFSMTWSYVGLVAAAAAETFTRLPDIWPQLAGQFPEQFFWSAVAVGSFSVCGIGWYLINHRRLGYPTRRRA